MSNSAVSVSSLRVTRARRRAQLAWTLVASLLLTLLGAVASPASATGFSISGVVTGQGAGNLAGAFACAYQGGNFAACSDATGSNGAYTVTLPSAGTYTIQFSAPETDFVAESWMNASLDAGTPVSVSGVLTGYDAELALGTHISGTVIGDTAGGTVPLAGVYVAAGESSDLRTFTDATGNYTIWGVAAGSYPIAFYAAPSTLYADEFWNDKPDLASADLVTVAAGVPLTGLATTLALGGSIAGNVKGLANANLESVPVQAFTLAGDFVDAASTDASGNYVITGLPAGSYKVEFAPFGVSYAPEWWNDKASFALADAIAVAAGAAVTGRDAVLAIGGTITGNVKDAASANIGGVPVSAIGSTGAYFSAPSTTDASGNFTIIGLPAGSYTLYFGGSALNYVDEYWNNKATQDAADYFAVTVGSTVSARNAVLAAGASISGNVTGGSPPASVEGASVFAFGESPEGFGVASTDASGNYIIKGLPADSYTLYFLPKETDNYLPEYWDGQSTFATANAFTVTAAAAVTGKNASLLTGTTISGTLKNSLGVPLSGEVLVYSATGAAASLDNLVESREVGVNGQYSITGLPVGSYRVGFTNAVQGLTVDGGLAPSNPYVSEWWNNRYTFSTATTVVLSAAGQSASNINGTLENPRFADVGDPSSTFYPFIEWMASKGISTGTVQPSGKPLYKPADAVSRQAMALFMFRLSEETFTPPVTATFADVATTSQFYTAIEWMAARGISAGTAQPVGKPLFKPSAPVSRQAMALFVARYASANLTVAPTTQRFADVPLGASSAAAINWMFVNGISTGSAQPSGLPLYKPSDPVTRQAMAAFLFRVNALSPTP